jgi:hypothetical protein
VDYLWAEIQTPYFCIQDWIAIHLTETFGIFLIVLTNVTKRGANRRPTSDLSSSLWHFCASKWDRQRSPITNAVYWTLNKYVCPTLAVATLYLSGLRLVPPSWTLTAVTNSVSCSCHLPRRFFCLWFLLLHLASVRRLCLYYPLVTKGFQYKQLFVIIVLMLWTDSYTFQEIFVS